MNKEFVEHTVTNVSSFSEQFIKSQGRCFQTKTIVSMETSDNGWSLLCLEYLCYADGDFSKACPLNLFQDQIDFITSLWWYHLKREVGTHL